MEKAGKMVMKEMRSSVAGISDGIFFTFDVGFAALERGVDTRYGHIRVGNGYLHCF